MFDGPETVEIESDTKPTRPGRRTIQNVQEDGPQSMFGYRRLGALSPGSEEVLSLRKPAFGSLPSLAFV